MNMNLLLAGKALFAWGTMIVLGSLLGAGWDGVSSGWKLLLAMASLLAIAVYYSPVRRSVRSLHAPESPRLRPSPRIGAVALALALLWLWLGWRSKPTPHAGYVTILRDDRLHGTKPHQSLRVIGRSVETFDAPNIDACRGLSESIGATALGEKQFSFERDDSKVLPSIRIETTRWPLASMPDVLQIAHDVAPPRISAWQAKRENTIPLEVSETGKGFHLDQMVLSDKPLNAFPVAMQTGSTRWEFPRSTGAGAKIASSGFTGLLEGPPLRHYWSGYLDASQQQALAPQTVAESIDREELMFFPLAGKLASPEGYWHRLDPVLEVTYSEQLPIYHLCRLNDAGGYDTLGESDARLAAEAAWGAIATWRQARYAAARGFAVVDRSPPRRATSIATLPFDRYLAHSPDATNRFALAALLLVVIAPTYWYLWRTL